MKFDIFLLENFSEDYKLYLKLFFGKDSRIQPKIINNESIAIIIYNKIYFEFNIKNLDFNKCLINSEKVIIDNYILYINYLKGNYIEYKTKIENINCLIFPSKYLEILKIDYDICNKLNLYTSNKFIVSLSYPKIIHQLNKIFNITDNIKEIFFIIRENIYFTKDELNLYFKNDFDINTLKKLHYYCNDLKNYKKIIFDDNIDINNWKQELTKNLKQSFIPKCKFKNPSIDFFPRNIIIYGSSFNFTWSILNSNFKHFSTNSNDEIVKLKMLYNFGGYLIPSNYECLIPIENWDFLNSNDLYVINNKIIITTSHNYKIKKILEYLQNKKQIFKEFEYTNLDSKYLQAYFIEK
jgi:hypothetical protein